MAITVGELARILEEQGETTQSQLAQAMRNMSGISLLRSAFQRTLDVQRQQTASMMEPLHNCFRQMYELTAPLFTQAQEVSGLVRESSTQNALASIQFLNAYPPVNLRVFEFNWVDLESLLGVNTMREAISSLMDSYRQRELEVGAAMAQAVKSFETLPSVIDILPEPENLPLTIRREPAPDINVGAYECLVRFKQHIADAEQKANEEGGYVLILCRTPEGQVLRRWKLEAIDPYFISVTGIDVDGQEQEFVTHYSELHVSISILKRDDVNEEPPLSIN